MIFSKKVSKVLDKVAREVPSDLVEKGKKFEDKWNEAGVPATRYGMECRTLIGMGIGGLMNLEGCDPTVLSDYLLAIVEFLQDPEFRK